MRLSDTLEGELTQTVALFRIWSFPFCDSPSYRLGHIFFNSNEEKHVKILPFDCSKIEKTPEVKFLSLSMKNFKKLKT